MSLNAEEEVAVYLMSRQFIEVTTDQPYRQAGIIMADRHAKAPRAYSDALESMVTLMLVEYVDFDHTEEAFFELTKAGREMARVVLSWEVNK